MDKLYNSIEIDNEKFLLATEPSPIDSRDFQAEILFTAETDLPREWDLRYKLLPVRNQGSQGSCVAMSCAVMKETQDKIDDYFSSQFVYNFRYNQPDQGMYPRDSMKILNKNGIVPESEYPYGVLQKPEDISQGIKDKAKNYIIQAYANINTIECLKTALFRNGACLICFPVYHGGGDFWKPKTADQKVSGYHAVAVVGYNSSGFIIRNSWGQKWNGNGYTTYPYADWGMHYDLWTTIDDNSTSDDPKYTRWYGRWWRYIRNSFYNLKAFALICILAHIVTIWMSYAENKYIVLAAIPIWIIFAIVSRVKGAYRSKGMLDQDNK